MHAKMFTVSITGRYWESWRGQLGPLGWRRAGLQDIIGHIFDELKKCCRSTQGNCFPPYLRLLIPLEVFFYSSPTAWGDGRGKRQQCWTPSFRVPTLGLFLSADINPPPLSEILFLHRFLRVEQEEVGRWSRQKRQANGPPTTSCSLFCDTKIVPRSVLHGTISLVRHSRRRNPVFQVWSASKWSVSARARKW